MAKSLQRVKSTNRVFGQKGVKGLVAVFVGGTSGNGEGTMKAFARHTKDSKVYFVGRSSTAASRITKELATINPSCQPTFIQADVSILSNVDSVLSQIRQQESKINILMFTTGLLTTKGRVETADGLDYKMVLHYYSRIHFTLGLLSLLKAAGASDTDTIGARVLSVLDPGDEGVINEEDLELKHSYTLKACAQQTCAFNSFALEKLSMENPEVGFIHLFPGFVATAVGRDMPFWAKPALKVFSMVSTISPEDAGEGIFGLLTGEKWKTGLSLIGLEGQDRDSRQQRLGSFKGAGGWWTEERRELVWRHTLEIMGRVKAAE